MDIIEQAKEANRLEDVIEETMPLAHKRGRYVRSREHDSFIVDTIKQFYTWNSKGETGDVIDWVMRRQGLDFKSAVELLCRRARLPDPHWTAEESEKRLVSRAREDAFQVAIKVMQGWLGKDAKALEYCKGRGWTEETIALSGVGFSGRGSAAEVSEMCGEFALHEIERESPQAVAILGWKGKVNEWGSQWSIEVQENWVEWGMIPGMMGKTRLVYPHMAFGKVRTLSGRNILGAETNQEGKEVKAFNLPVALAGERQLFYNHAYQPRAEECVIVEGQADAITLGQWGMAAVATAGTGWKDHELRLEELRKRHRALYLGMDADQAGLEALVGRDKDWPLGRVLGPMTRLVNWAGVE